MTVGWRGATAMLVLPRRCWLLLVVSMKASGNARRSLSRDALQYESLRVRE